MEVLTLGEKIKKRRTELDLTLKDLAGDKVTPGQISLVESSKSNPSMDLLSYISEILDIPINYLMESERAQAEDICKHYRNMVEINLTHNNLPKAKEYIDKSSFYIDKYDLDISKAKNIFLTALYEIKNGNLDEAFKNFFKCNLIYMKNNNLADLVRSFVFAAEAYTDEKSIPIAISFFHKSEALFATGEIRDDFLLNQIYYNLAVLYKKDGDLRKSNRYIILAKDKFESLEDKVTYSKKLSIMAEEYELQGKTYEAKRYSEMALRLVKEHNKQIEEIKMIYNIGLLYFDLEDYDTALTHFTKILPHFKSKLKDDLIDLEIRRAFCFAKTNQKDLFQDLIEELDNMIIEEDFVNGIKLFKLKYYSNEIFGNKKEAYYNLVLALNMARYKKLDREEYEILMIMANHFINRDKEYYGYRYLTLAMEKKEDFNGGE